VRENVVAQPELVRRFVSASNARACPIVSRPPRRSAWISSGSPQQRSESRSSCGPADAPGELLLRPAELAEELFVGLGLIDRIQVFAEQVLDERKLEAFGIGRVADDRGMRSSPACRAARQRRSPAMS